MRDFHYVFGGLTLPSQTSGRGHDGRFYLVCKGGVMCTRSYGAIYVASVSRPCR